MNLGEGSPKVIPNSWNMFDSCTRWFVVNGSFTMFSVRVAVVVKVLKPK